MWVLQNSKELLEYLISPYFNQVTNIKSFDYCALNTTIRHLKLKNRVTRLVHVSDIPSFVKTVTVKVCSIKQPKSKFFEGALLFQNQVI